MAEQKFIGSYYRKKVNDRIRMLYSNYCEFPQMIEGYEDGLTLMITSIKSCERRRDKGDLGVRVQTSIIQNTTAQIAVENVTIEEMIASGELGDMTFKDLEDAKDVALGMDELNLMKLEYKAFKKWFEALPEDERRILLEDMRGLKDGTEIADELGISTEALYVKVSRIKKKLYDRIKTFMCNYDDNMVRIGGEE